MVAGVARGWWRAAPPGRARTAVLCAFAFFFLENALFANQHQEYGVLELASWDRGQPYAEPSLLAFAANQIGGPVDRAAVAHFALPMPDWVYPLWGVLAAGLILVVARRAVGRPWVATALAGGYAGYRCLVWAALTGAGFPPSTVPFYLIAVGLAVDAAALSRLPAALAPAGGAVLVTAAGYLALAAQAEWIAAPPASLPSVLAAAALLALAWYGVEAARPRRGAAEHAAMRADPAET
jgi:hypothetical protein